MPIIEFHYAGAVNSYDVSGYGELASNTDDGRFDANVGFSGMPSEVPLLAWAVSLLSISCSNGGRARQARNILSTTHGPYRSIRTISLMDMSTGVSVGLLRIAGRFSGLSGDRLSADVQLSGSYFGPPHIDYSQFQGYSLPTTPMIGLDVPALYGVTHISLKHESGMLSAKHEQLYLFEAGITNELEPNIMRVFFSSIEADSYPNSIHVAGTSEIFPLPAGSSVSWFDRP